MEKLPMICLWVNTEQESREAIVLLAEIGVPMEVNFTTRRLEPDLPCALHLPWNYKFKGIERIRELRTMMEDEAKGVDIWSPRLKIVPPPEFA